jgi:hypothetical protein
MQDHLGGVFFHLLFGLIVAISSGETTQMDAAGGRPNDAAFHDPTSFRALTDNT